MAIIKQGNARMGALKESLQETIDAMEEEYPEISFSLVRDQTRLLDFAISNLGQSLAWGVSLAFLVMFLFMGDFKSPLLIGISVPVSMVVCMLLFYFIGISINIISLSGLILGTGLMIDNAIIVIDNITQFREKGHPLTIACVLGTEEVFKPLLSSVLTTCAVFVPLIFLGGISGALFYDQAVAISIGLIVSLLISVTLLPVLYRLFFLKEKNKGKLGQLPQKYKGLGYMSLYEKGFRLAIRRQGLVFSLAGLLIALTVWFLYTLPKEQMPELTSTETILQVDWNEPLNVEENKKRIKELVGQVNADLEQYYGQVGRQQFLLINNSESRTEEASVYLHAKSPEQLLTVQQKIAAYISKKFPLALLEYTEADNVFNLVFSDADSPLTARLRYVKNLGETQNSQLESLWADIRKKLPNIPLAPIAWDNQLTLLVDMEKLATYGIPYYELESALRGAFSEKHVFSLAGNQHMVPIVIGGKQRNLHELLEQVQVKGGKDTYYRVTDFLTIHRTRDLKSVTAGKEGEYFPLDMEIDKYQEASVIQTVKSIVAQNPYFDTSFSGSLLKNKELVKELMIVLCISLGLLFFILASQFESLTLPLIILIEVPVSMAGALLLIYCFGMSLNLMSMIGIVVMCGIIINDSILKIDSIIRFQKQGHGLLMALLLAGHKRLKPILMTSITTILAVFPLLFFNGLGAELQAPLAVALIGGMFLGTAVSLYLIPVCYYRLVKKKKHVF